MAWPTLLPACQRQIGERVLASVAFVSAPEIAQLGPAGQALVAQASDAFVSGVGSAVLVGSVILAMTRWQCSCSRRLANRRANGRPQPSAQNWRNRHAAARNARRLRVRATRGGCERGA